jgi:putative ABC transport system permease protein
MRYLVRSLTSWGWRAVSLIVSVGLGIGSVAMCLSVLASLLYQPLPYSEGERLYSIWRPSRTYGRSLVSPGQVQAVAEALDGNGEVAAIRPGFVATEYDLDLPIQGQRPRRLAVTGVTWNYFDVVGVSPVLGRSFLREDALLNQPRAIVLGHALWLSAFHGTPEIVGRTIRLRNRKGEASYEVVGVMPPGFSSLYSVPAARRPDRLFVEDLWMPIPLDPRLWSNHKRFWGLGVVRLSRGTSLREAQVRIETVSRKSEKVGDSESSLHLVNLREEVVGPSGPIATSSAILAAFLWLQSILAFGTATTVRLRGKARDLFILRALGSTEARIRTEVWTETAVLTLAAAALGYLIAHSVASLLILALSTTNPQILKIADAPFMAIGCIALGSGTLIFVGVCAEAELRGQRSIRRVETSRIVFGDRAVFVQICVGTALLIITAAVAHRAITIANVEVGFRSDRGVLATVDLPIDESNATARLAMQNALIEEVERTSGVRGALTNSFPFLGVSYAGEFVEWESRLALGVAQEVKVSEGFLELLEIPLRVGRYFSKGDMFPSSDVAIVSEAWVQRYSTGRNPIGRQIMFAGPVWRRIVGVVGDVRDGRVSQSPEPTIYLPLAGDAVGRHTIVAVGSDARAEEQALESAIGSLLPASAVDGPTSIHTIVASQTQAARFYGAAFAALAAAGWLASLSGIYVLVLQLSWSRRRELAIRSALGATPRRLVWVLCGRVLIMSLLAGTAGAGLAMGLTSLLQAALLEMDETPALVTGAAWVAVVIATAITAYVPARREAMSNPAEGLRSA